MTFFASFRKRVRHPGEEAFSLAEILLAMAVAALLMTMLLSILSKSMDVSKRTNAGMLSKSSAQAALDLITTDLESMSLNRSLDQVLFTTNSRVKNAAFTMSNSILYLLSASPTDSYGTNGGMPRLVQYSIVYTNSYASISNSTFSLYRNVLDQSNTVKILEDFKTNAPDGTPISFHSEWDALQSQSQDDGREVAGMSTNMLVPNVVAFNVSLLTNYGEGVWTKADVTNSSYGRTNFQPGIVAEVCITVLDEPAMTRFGNGNGVGNNAPAIMINSQGRTLVRRVTLPCPP